MFDIDFVQRHQNQSIIATVAFEAIICHSGGPEQDHIDSVALANLIASKRADRWSDTNKWAREHDSALARIGWLLKKSSSASPRLSQPTFTAPEAILELCEAHTSFEDFKLITDTVEIIDQLRADDKRHALLNNFGCNDNKCRLSVIISSGAAYSIVRTEIMIIANEGFVGGIWNARLSTVDTSFSLRLDCWRLSTDVYSSIRDDIRNKLLPFDGVGVLPIP